MIRYWYRIYFTNKQGVEILIEISDTDYDLDEGDTVSYIDLIGIAPALELEQFGTGEDEFSPIIGSRATIRFRSTTETNFHTFTEGRDNRWSVRASYNNGGPKFIFTGFLVMDDNQRAFLPPGRDVVLTATDNLGLLRDLPITQHNNVAIDLEARYKVIDVIEWCLGKAGFVYPSGETFDGIWVVNNLFEFNQDNRNGGGVNIKNCALSQTYINALDLLKSPNEFKDCHTVLTEILISWGMRVVQHDNNWILVRIDEYKNALFNYSKYLTTSPTPLSGHVGQSFDKDIRSTFDVIEAQTIERIRRPYRETAINIPYKFPEELPQNDVFIRGTLRVDSTTDEKRYDPESWDFYKGLPSTTNDGDVYIRKKLLVGGYQDERYMVFAVQPSAADYYIESAPIPCCAGDKFGTYVDIRHDGQVETASVAGNYNVFQIRLYADDSTYYILDPIDSSTSLSRWFASDATWSTNNKFFKRFYDGEEDDTEWHNIGAGFEDNAAIPKTGFLTIVLHQTKKSNEFETHFQNLRFEYVPLVQGSFRKLDGEIWRQYSEEGMTAKYQQNATYYDAPCKSFKGAMTYLDGVHYITSNWTDWNIYVQHPDGMLPEAALGPVPFSRWQVYSLWNQFRRPRRIFEFRLFNLDTTNGHAGAHHRYTYLASQLGDIF
jgi:hypothetical protein